MDGEVKSKPAAQMKRSALCFFLVSKTLQSFVMGEAFSGKQEQLRGLE